MSLPALPTQPVAAETDDLGQSTQPLSGSILYALVSCRRRVIAATLLGTVIGLALGLMKANAFTSSGTLLLRSGAREAATAESTVEGRESLDMRPLDYLANEMQILSHRDVCRRVIDQVGVDRILEVYDPAAEDSAETSFLSRTLHRMQSWWFASSSAELQAASPERRQHLAFKTLMAKLTLRPSGSSMIRVSYDAHTPELAKEIVDAFLAAAEEHHRQVFSNRTSFEFLTVVEKQARDGVQAANAALIEFKQKHGLFDLGVQRTSLIQEVVKLETQLASDEEQLQVQESRCESLRRQLADEQKFEEVVTQAPSVENPECAALREQIFTLRKEQATIRGDGVDRRETERKVKELDELIANTEQRLLGGVPALLPGPKSSQTVKNPGYERLRGLLNEDELKLVGLRVTRDQQAARLEQLRKRVQGLEEIAPAYDALVQEVAKHENDGRRFLESLKRTELLNLLDENKLSNLRRVEAGDLPVEKSGPNRALWALAGAAFGLMLGVGVALLRHRFDGSVRRAQDLQAVGAEVLGVVPESRAVASNDLMQDADLDGAHDRLLRRRLDSVWATLLPSRIPRDFQATIAMVGDEHSSGVTTLAVHLAARIASCHQLDVLLIETNYRHPTLAARLGLDGAPGLADLIDGAATRDDVVCETVIPGLRIVHAGTNGAAFRGPKPGQGDELLRMLSDGFRIVVLDVPSVVEHPQFRQLLWHADLVVPVFAAGRSTKESVRRHLQGIESVGKRAHGAILNRWRSIRPFWLPRSLDL
jgi:uncharacterized protein involved in exopolysaccharide biosynthesis/Mrp family chromosome partitioning ATPase